MVEKKKKKKNDKIFTSGIGVDGVGASVGWLSGGGFGVAAVD
jgi:hypothetical protein